MQTIETLKMSVIKRNGDVVPFNQEKIKNAILKAVKATNQKIEDNLFNKLLSDISEEIGERFKNIFPNVENIQDVVEKHLVKNQLYEISKAYILYRAERQKARELEKAQTIEKAKTGHLYVTKKNGTKVLFDLRHIRNRLSQVIKDYEDLIDQELIIKELMKNVYDGITTQEIEKALTLASVAFVEKDPAYDFVSGRLFLQKMYNEVIGYLPNGEALEEEYKRAFVNGIKEAVQSNFLDKRMLDFNLNKLADSLIIKNDQLFKFLGLQTLNERYFIRKFDNALIELPQSFWMRVAMGLSLNEDKKEEKAIEFYNVMSRMLYVPSTPTLFHSGLIRSQLSSCYLTTIEDDLTHIFKCIGDNAQLSKWSGGLGNDWSNLRATGALIKTIKVESQGVIPFLKIANDTTAAINRSGKRRGATCAYLETWHLDIEDFLDLRRNTGDERRRAHDMNTSNWIPDLFMKRVLEGADWTLFSPEETPDLHHLYGKKFDSKYIEYEEKAKQGIIKKFKVMPAQQLWKRMLTRLFETGHPWITFKDPCNIRSPQDHVGIIHSSNLCTEITLNTSKEEISVCNLASINLSKFIKENKIDEELLSKTIKTGIRMLDNVIDLNYYPVIEARNSNLKHRPVGLGIMGFADALYLLDIPFQNQKAIRFADTIMEFISYHAILSSSELAKERGPYLSYKGSKWDRDIFPIDTVKLLEEERGIKTGLELDENLDWKTVRDHVKRYGMRNSNTMAIAPTATIANISGCIPCIEPIYKNIYVKANMSGEAPVINPYMVEDLKKLNLWNDEMLEQIKYYDGNLEFIAGIPQNIKDKYKEVFEIDPLWLIDLTAVRSKWIDQSQSHNVFVKGVSGNKLNEIYFHAWKRGLKTTYYLRTLAASQIEKSTLDAAKYGYTQTRKYKDISEYNKETKKIISTGETCEACQ